MVGTENQNVVEQKKIVDVDMNSTLTKSFAMMFSGLIITAIVAMVVYYTGFFTSKALMLFPIFAIAEVVVVLVFSFLFKKLPSIVVRMLFYAYAILNGFTLSIVFVAYDLGSIGICFFATAAIFGALAVYGAKTKRDLTKWGPIILIGLIVGIALTIVNLFMHSSWLAIGIDWLILILFCGATIYDIKRIQDLSADIDNPEKLHVYGAMQLYLDFINIFLRILSLFGKRN